MPAEADLTQAYRAASLELVGQRQAEAVMSSAQGVTVLTTQMGPDGDQSGLIRLDDGGSVLWERRYEVRYGVGRSFASRNNAGFIIAGEFRCSVSAYQGYLLQVDAAGAVVAARAIGPPGPTGLSCVVTLTDGETVAGGTTDWSGWLLRADATSQSDIALPQSSYVSSLAPGPNGGFTAACVFDNSTTSLGRARVIRWASEGATDWCTELPASGRGELTGLAALPDGSIAAVGHKVGDENAIARLWVVRLDTGGAVLWQHELGVRGVEARGRAITLLPDQGIAAAGDFMEGVVRRGHVVRLDTSGAVLWEHSLGDADRYTIVRGIAAMSGGMVLVGSTQHGDEKTTAWVVRLHDDGSKLWEHSFPALL